MRGVVTVESFTQHFDIPQLELVRLIFTPFDEDGNGILDFEEFLLILCTFASYTRPELLMYIFRIFDANNGGTIDRQEFNRLVRTMHDGENLFPKELALAVEQFHAANADNVDDITFDQFRAADRRTPLLLWPAFRVQERLQNMTLGAAHFQKLMETNHPEIFQDTAELVLRRQQRNWLNIQTYVCCLIPLLKWCCDPDWSTKTFIIERCPKLYLCCYSVFCSCGRKSRLDVVDPFAARRAADEHGAFCARVLGIVCVCVCV